MKVVLFCGGLGTRLREFGDNIPKPLVPLGYRPVLWHLMKYYAHFGHKDFILCLGYKADKIKEYFLHYDEAISNDFVLSQGGRQVDLLRSDIDDWRITFVDTGLHSNIGQRFRAIRHLVEDDEMFLANYADGLTDMPLPQMIDAFRQGTKIAAFVCAPPSQTFHLVNLGDDNRVMKIQPVREAGLLVNCGFFAFRPAIFEYIQEGEELVAEPFSRLIASNQLMGYRYDRFWAMDTFKEQQELTDLCARGEAPWEVWKQRKGRENSRKLIVPDFDVAGTAPAA
ncbi:MAG: glucose-1-phosphate cytidylyltransferase [Verrucomicrobia bacterium]|nr:glucose-1-phosphate cytidylyltransferase [Verrucomicrobiota bacterium]